VRKRPNFGSYMRPRMLSRPNSSSCSMAGEALAHTKSDLEVASSPSFILLLSLLLVKGGQQPLLILVRGTAFKDFQQMSFHFLCCVLEFFWYKSFYKVSTR
jgi:ABC-type spermidine/putrescine transport system permease subunit I